MDVFFCRPPKDVSQGSIGIDRALLSRRDALKRRIFWSVGLNDLTFEIAGDELCGYFEGDVK
jgi:hypothetical protein